MQRAVIYARYSPGPNQTEQSIEGQVRECTKYAELHDLRIVGTYIDRKISGKTDNRREFQRMIDDSEKHIFDVIILYHTDRFARNRYDSAIYKHKLKENGVELRYATTDIPKGPEGIILESIMEGWAEYYSAELSRKIKRGMRESALKCHSTGAGRCLGYRTAEDKSLVIEPEGAKAAQTVFDMYIKGKSHADICRYLNDCGFRTAQGKLFNKNSVTHIIRNKRYIGVYTYDDITIEDGIPAIISKDTFHLAQLEAARRKTAKRPKEPKAEYLLSGKAFCGHCQKPLVGVSGTGKSGNKWYYYYCQESRAKRGCTKRPVKRDWLEREVVERTVAEILQPEVIQRIAKKCYDLQMEYRQDNSDVLFYELKLKDVRKAIKNTMHAIESGVKTKTLPARLQELENEEEALEAELAIAKASDFVITTDQIEFLLTQFAEPWECESEEEYHRRIIKCFVHKVFLFDDKLLIYYNVSRDGKTREQSEAELLEEALGEGFDKRSSGSTKRNGHDVSSCPFLLAVELFLNPPSSQNSGPGCHTRDRCCLKLILHVEAEVDHVAVLHHILLAFAAELALLLGGVDTAVLDHIIIGNDLRPDEAPLDVSVDFTGGLRGLGALFDGPGAALILAVGQERDKAQQGVAALDEPIQTGFCDAQLVQEHLPVLALQLSDVLLQLGTDGQHLAALGFCQRTDLLQILVALLIGKAVLVHVGGVDDGLQG